LKTDRIIQLAAEYAVQDYEFEAWIRDTQMARAGKQQSIEAMSGLYYAKRADEINLPPGRRNEWTVRSGRDKLDSLSYMGRRYCMPGASSGRATKPRFS